MTTFKQICIRNFDVVAENGDHGKVSRGKEYITSEEDPKGDVTVFTSPFWIRVPATFFAGKEKYT